MGSRPRPAEQRFWKYVKKTTTCWLWVGATYRGYGLFSANGKHVRAHRWAYEQSNGSIPEMLTLDHLCRNRSCVNPNHLEPVTNKENVLRGFGPPAQNARKTKCKYGHPLEGNNLYVEAGRRRGCRRCGSERQMAYRKREKVKGLPAEILKRRHI